MIGGIMFILRLKSSITLFLFLFFFAFLSHAEQSASSQPSLRFDERCVATGMDNLKRRFSSLSEEDIKNITLYGCFCAYKEAQRTQLPSVGQDFWNASDCIYYAVLRNAMFGAGDAASINNRCLASYPRDLTDDSANEDVANFCQCASGQVSAINSGKEATALTEEQLYEQILPISKSCR